MDETYLEIFLDGMVKLCENGYENKGVDPEGLVRIGKNAEKARNSLRESYVRKEQLLQPYILGKMREVAAGSNREEDFNFWIDKLEENIAWANLTREERYEREARKWSEKTDEWLSCIEQWAHMSESERDKNRNEFLRFMNEAVTIATEYQDIVKKEAMPWARQR